MKKILILILLAISVLGFAQETVNVGETWSVGLSKINSNFTESFAEIDTLTTKVEVFASMTTPIYTQMDSADVWYKLNGVYTNTVLNGFTADSTGITLSNGDQLVFAGAMVGGYSDDTAIIRLGFAKNAEISPTGSIDDSFMLSGSGGGVEVSEQAALEGFGNVRNWWLGELESGDKITIMIKSSVAGARFTPEGGNAFLFDVK